MIPAIIVRTEEICSSNQTLENLYSTLREKRIAIKEAFGYPFDNEYFFLSDITGNIYARFSISKIEKSKAFPGPRYSYTLSLYDLSGQHHIGYFARTPSSTDLDTIADHIAKHRLRCDQCHEWRLAKNLLTYSFAGTICKKCYNPKKHLPPDTRGD